MLANTEAPKCGDCKTEHPDASNYYSFFMFTDVNRIRRRIVVCGECGAILWMNSFQPLTGTELAELPERERHNLYATRRLVRAIKMARN
ncbi:MAG TPA: hypothetical protein VEH27_18120 [Methylomirabilota bacterium]|nr:hypothetical protein [Methylomirabilota bacterium]